MGHRTIISLLIFSVAIFHYSFLCEAQTRKRRPNKRCQAEYLRTIAPGYGFLTRQDWICFKAKLIAAKRIVERTGTNLTVASLYPYMKVLVGSFRKNESMWNLDGMNVVLTTGYGFIFNYTDTEAQKLIHILSGEKNATMHFTIQGLEFTHEASDIHRMIHQLASKSNPQPEILHAYILRKGFSVQFLTKSSAQLSEIRRNGFLHNYFPHLKFTHHCIELLSDMLNGNTTILNMWMEGFDECMKTDPDGADVNGSVTAGKWIPLFRSLTPRKLVNMLVTLIKHAPAFNPLAFYAELMQNFELTDITPVLELFGLGNFG